MSPSDITQHQTTDAWFWADEKNPTGTGWYPVKRLFDPEEGETVGASYWTGAGWLDPRPGVVSPPDTRVVAWWPSRSNDQTEAEEAAADRDAEDLDAR